MGNTSQAKEKAIEKVQKLLKITKENGSSEAEINMALDSIRKIIIKHSLVESEYEIQEDNSYRHSYKTSHMSYEVADWQTVFINQLCGFYSCYGYSSGVCFNIIGAKSDVKLVVETADFLMPMVSHLALTGYQTYANSIRNGYEAMSGKRLSIKQCQQRDIISITKAKYVKSYIQGFTVGMVKRLTPVPDEDLTQEEVDNYSLITTDKIEAIREEIMKEVELVNIQNIKPKLSNFAWKNGYKDGKKEPNIRINQ